ncbi:MAG TPA: hypothetical protein VLC71_06125 [Thermomonas sp.]|nr:hypothetical protein [Thermomonas sp.]
MIPLPGTFLHPDGRLFALEVTHVFPDGDGLPRVRCRRWGWRDGRVIDDGHRSDDHMLSLRYRGPGCWSTAAWRSDDPSMFGFNLWRSVPGPTGQIGLFA